MDSKLERAIEILRGDLERHTTGLVKVFPDQLAIVLDALQGQAGEELDLSHFPGLAEFRQFRVGDKVKLSHYTMFGNRLLRKGHLGVVEYVNYDELAVYPISVKLEGEAYEKYFDHDELTLVESEEKE